MFPGETEGIQIVEMQQILGAPTLEEIQEYKKTLICNQASDLFEKLCNLEKNEKMNLVEMLKQSPAYKN